MATEQNFTGDDSFVRGDDQTFNLAFSDGDGNVINITGWTVFFTLKTYNDDVADDSNAIITKTVTSHTTPLGGITKFSLTDIETKDLAGEYRYDIQIKKSTGIIKTILYGKINFVKDTTRRIS